MIPVILLGGALMAYLILQGRFKEGPIVQSLTDQQEGKDAQELKREIVEVLFLIQRQMQQAGGDAAVILSRIQAMDQGSSYAALWSRRYSSRLIPADPVSAELYPASLWRLYEPSDEILRNGIALLRRAINSSALPIRSDRWSSAEASATGIGGILALSESSSWVQVAESLDRFYRWLWSCSFYASTGPLWGPYLRCGSAWLYWFLPANLRQEVW